MFRLLFQGSRAKEAPIIVREPLVVIGRDTGCQVRLLEKGVSDRHAAIERREDGYYLCDLNSATGVRLNDKPAALQRLASGDAIELGSVRLRFEILHDIESARRAPDWLRAAAVVAVGLLLIGQVALLVISLKAPRPARLPKASRAGRAPATAPANIQPPAPPPATRAAAPAPAPPAAAASAPAVLNRMIHLRRVTAATVNDRLRLLIEIRAQVGERELNTGATAVAIQFFINGPDGKTLPMRTPLWLNVAGLQNFTTKQFSAYFPGKVTDYGGYVIRTYYRGELQDQAAQPPALANLVPPPEPSSSR